MMSCKKQQKQTACQEEWDGPVAALPVEAFLAMRLLACIRILS